MNIEQIRQQFTTPEALRQHASILRQRSITSWTAETVQPQGAVIHGRDPRETLDYIRGNAISAVADIQDDLAKIDALTSGQPGTNVDANPALAAVGEAVRQQALSNITTLQSVLDLSLAAENFRVINKGSYAIISGWMRIAEELLRCVVADRTAQLKRIELLAALNESVSHS